MSHNGFAKQYDKEVRAYSSYGHNVVFGMAFEYVHAGEKLLDLGIGTGLSSVHFADIGLKVCGIDVSKEMLDACQSKSFTEALTQCDISRDPIPYENQFFNHVVGCGVLHFLEDLTALFTEVKRVIKTGGIFAFTIATQESGVDAVKEDTAWGIPIFKHSSGYILKLLKTNNMELLKEQRLLIKGADKERFDMLFSVFICRSRKV